MKSLFLDSDLHSLYCVVKMYQGYCASLFEGYFLDATENWFCWIVFKVMPVPSYQYIHKLTHRFRSHVIQSHSMKYLEMFIHVHSISNLSFSFVLMRFCHMLMRKWRHLYNVTWKIIGLSISSHLQNPCLRGIIMMMISFCFVVFTTFLCLSVGDNLGCLIFCCFDPTTLLKCFNYL